jgi:hypothetical protein
MPKDEVLTDQFLVLTDRFLVHKQQVDKICCKLQVLEFVSSSLVHLVEEHVHYQKSALGRLQISSDPSDAEFYADLVERTESLENEVRKLRRYVKR